ncbi:hypothetical protein PVK06_043657 [Gossypium arboreum]|uniref:Uncharacterized protein n=1 Tax=Gossypium arboreum TaxID=29729 RepID=A0ABR0MP26_GOSAR|nr:hypothetical protein PVK06_043657 [Gossypium arboreum]
MLKRNFHPKYRISLLSQEDLGKQVYKTISKLNWETFYTHPGSYSPSLVRESYANLYNHELEFIFIREGLIQWETKKRNKLYNTKVDVGEHSKFIDDITDEKLDLLTGILVFPSLVMLLCEQRGIAPHVGEEVLENKGPINEASVERMTHGKDTPILKKVETISDNEKEEESKDTEECLQKIDSLFEDGNCTDQEDIVVEKEVAAAEEEVVVEVEEVAKNEKEKEKEDSVEKTVTAPVSMGANIDNLEQTGVRLVEVAEDAVGDTEVELKIEEQSKDRAKPKEKKRKRSKDKKRRMRRKGGERNIM